jgi:hypothetical protein
MRSRVLFGLLVLGQLVHSCEEFVGRLWESFPPAAAVSRAVASDPEAGFLAINIGLNAVGVLALAWALWRRRPMALPVGWLFVVIEIVNGVGHPLWAIRQQAYTPGVATAPILLVLAVLLARELWRQGAGREVSQAHS